MKTIYIVGKFIVGNTSKEIKFTFAEEYKRKIHKLIKTLINNKKQNRRNTNTTRREMIIKCFG